MNRERRAKNKTSKFLYDVKNTAISDVYENFKITAPAERTIKFRIAPGQKGYYQVTINDKVVRSKTIEYPEDE
jgi:serine/threonine-protein kinase